MAGSDSPPEYIDVDDDDASTSGHQLDNLSKEDYERVTGIDEELSSVDLQIRQLNRLRTSLALQRQQVLDAAAQHDSTKGTASRGKGVDYTTNSFEWSKVALQTARKVFGIENFRSCQEAAVNACMDGRDVILIMATGGGKSLVYQLPAVLSGPTQTTVVISPLISLMNDQAFHLQDLIEFEVLSGARSPVEIKNVLARIRDGVTDGSEERTTNLLFATPERVSSSKGFVAALQKCYERGDLARIVIDEAHCCSQQGHDFRPDYRKLSILRQLFPKTPITCLTATCGPKILEDLLQIIGMPPVTSPNHAAPRRTVYLTAPLYRPNLVYSVVQRPNSAQDAVKAIADWIQTKHPGQSGIVYCLSRKDTVTMSEALYTTSEGALRTAVYNADLDDQVKAKVHADWRNGKVKVICATVAFGMGIDKGNVRFVVHSMMSRSMDGFYQESGRAGRDGNDADCVLFYRPQDASRIISMAASQPSGISKAMSMLSYAQSSECRKLIFGSYFADRFATSDPCKRCDNCTSDSNEQDSTWPAWQIVKVVDAVRRGSGRVTIANLVDLVRGNGGGKYQVISRRDGKHSTAPGGVVNLEEVSQGKVGVSKDNVERIIVALLVSGYLAEELQATAYVVNVYVTTGRNAIRLTRHDASAARLLKGMVRVSFVGGETLEGGVGKKVNKTRKGNVSAAAKDSRALASASHANDGWGSVDEDAQPVKTGNKRSRPSHSARAEEILEEVDIIAAQDEDDWEVLAGSRKSSGRNASDIGRSTRKRALSKSPIMIDSDS